MATAEKTTHALGNTKARAWQITLNQVVHYDEIKNYICNLKSMRYFLSAKELAPSTGHEHIHIYCNFTNAIKLSHKKTFNAHLEMCRGTPQQNIKYIKKDGDILDEIGEPPVQGGYRVKDLKEMDSPDELPAILHNTWKRIHNEPKKVKVSEWHKEIEVVYITGPSGIGKSLKAKEIMTEKGIEEFEEIKFDKSGFFHGIIDGKGCAVYDDFRDSDMKANEFINLIDYNVHNLNIKGGSIKNNYNLLIITSIKHPEELYLNMPEEARIQWMRRIKVINLYDALSV